MTTQTRPMMPLTVGMPASIRIRKNTPPTAPAVPEMPEIKLPPRGTTGPVHISKLLEPLQQIIRPRTGTGCWRNFSRTHKINV